MTTIKNINEDEICQDYINSNIGIEDNSLTNYKFQCPQCGQNYEVVGMPPIEIFKQIPHTMTCPKCNNKVSMIQ